MPSPYPFQPNARADATWDDTPDWTVSDYPVFEKAIADGALSGVQRVAEKNDGGANKTPRGAKLLPWLNDWNRFVVEQHLAAPDQVNSFNLRAGAYFGPRFRTWGTLQDLKKNKPGTITREQDGLAREFFNAYKDNPDSVGQFKQYNDAIASGRLRVVP